jgi:uncharacterized protein
MKLTIEGTRRDEWARGYSSAGVRINDRVYEGSVIVSAASVIDHWPPRSVDDDRRPTSSRHSALKPDVLLIGTGHRQRFQRPRCSRRCTAHGPDSKSQDTGAAVAPTTCSSASDATWPRP